MNAIDLLELHCRLRQAERSIDVLCISPVDRPEYLSYMKGRIDKLNKLVSDIAKPHGDNFIRPAIFDPYTIPALSYVEWFSRKMKFLATGTMNYSQAEIRYILCSHQVLLSHLRDNIDQEIAPMHLRYALGISRYIIRRSICGRITKLMNLPVAQFMQPSHMRCYNVNEIVEMCREHRRLA